MSHPEGPREFDPCGCDPEKVFELADGGLGTEQEQKIKDHLASCQRCRELYERELYLNASLSSLDFSGMRCCSGSVCRGVAMALPTRSARMRLLWGLLASVLLVVALVSLKFNGMEPVILTMGTLSVCWGFVAGATKVAHVIFTTTGPVILLMLALGALADVLIALALLFASRNRRTREA